VKRAAVRLATRLLGGPAVRQVVKNSGWSFAAVAVFTVAVFAETVVLARYLSPAEYGVLLLIIAFPEAVQQIFDFRIREAMTKYLGGFLAQGERDKAVAVVKLLWLIDVIVVALAFLVVFATAGLAARVIVHRPDVAHLMVLYSGGLVLAGFDSASGSVLRVLDRFRLSFLGATVGAVARLGGVFTVVALGGGLEAFILARIAAEACGTAVLGGLALRELAREAWSQRRAPIRLLRGQLREIGWFLVNTNLAGGVRAISTKLDTVLVGALAGPTTVSVYKIGIQFGTAPLLLSDALFTAVFPTFARLMPAGKIREMREVARRTSMLIAGCVLPACIVFAFVGPTLIGGIFGESYTGAALPATLCLAGVAGYVVFFWTQPLILTAGYPGAFLRLITAATIVQFALLAALVPHFGAAGAAAALGVMYLIAVVLALAFIRARHLLEPGVGGPTATGLSERDVLSA
jgi:O-antigen/teichoic acid export membrane protein